MRKFVKVLLAISCLLPLTCLIAFAEEVKLPDGSLVDVTPYYGVDDMGCPVDEYGNPNKDYYYYFYPAPGDDEHSVTEFVDTNGEHIKPIEIEGYDYVRDFSIVNTRLLDNFYTIDYSIFEDVIIGDKVVFFSVTAEPYILTVDHFDNSYVYLTSDAGITASPLGYTYFAQRYVAEQPPLIEQVSAWIIGCFSTVGFVLGSFAEGNEIVTFFLLVIPLSGLIFAFVKSLIYRR